VNELLGKYAIFVVPAYGLTLVTFLALSVIITRRMLYWEKRAAENAAKAEKKK
jgi:heme exporter protein D